jgi:hypothetical protein
VAFERIRAARAGLHLVLTFWAHGRGGRIQLTHVNVADSDFAGVSEGWAKYYFIPWRAYLEGK